MTLYNHMEIFSSAISNSVRKPLQWLPQSLFTEKFWLGSRYFKGVIINRYTVVLSQLLHMPEYICQMQRSICNLQSSPKSVLEKPQSTLTM